MFFGAGIFLLNFLFLHWFQCLDHALVVGVVAHVDGLKHLDHLPLLS